MKILEQISLCTCVTVFVDYSCRISESKGIIYTVAVLTDIAKLSVWITELKVKEKKKKKKLIVLEEKIRTFFVFLGTFPKPNKNSHATKERLIKHVPEIFFILCTTKL